MKKYNIKKNKIKSFKIKVIKNNGCRICAPSGK